MTTRDEWLARFARELGTEAPDADTVTALLDLAAEAAHASERTAAPLACYLLGRTHASIEHGLATAKTVTAELASD